MREEKLFIYYSFLDAPIVGTMPHFYGADPVYNLMIDGTFPNPDKHQIFMELEPRTGSPLRGGKKLQFNMFLRKIDNIAITNHFTTPILFPVLWVDEGLELNKQMTGMIKGDLINVLLILDIVQWSLGKITKKSSLKAQIKLNKNSFSSWSWFCASYWHAYMVFYS